MDERDLLREQVEYYQARAGEYDEWFLREGRYDRGPEHRARWFSEVAIVEAALQKTLQSGEVLELACGTGLWTQHLVKQHSRVVAIDASPEAIAINRERADSDVVEYIVADLFNWTPPGGRFDAIFFGFWLSHVPPGHFDAFWATVQRRSSRTAVSFSSIACSNRHRRLEIMINSTNPARFGDDSTMVESSAL